MFPSPASRRIAPFVAVAIALGGCSAKVTRHVVQSEIPELDEPEVRSVHLVDGRLVRFVGVATVIGDSVAYAVAGQDSSGTAIVIPRDRIVEAEISTERASFPGAWLVTGGTVLGLFFGIIMSFKAH